ncbi:Beta-galactosidase 13, partial [Linum perenne]
TETNFSFRSSQIKTEHRIIRFHSELRIQKKQSVAEEKKECHYLYTHKQTMSSIAGAIFTTLILVAFSSSVAVAEQEKGVRYDGRSLIINGKRQLLFSGSIHYPRSTPDMWPDLLGKAKRGGLNVIQTYVFWNVHEPVQGQYNFEGRNDIVKFIRTIGEMGMYVTIRVGPFIEAEWNHGGFPFWLREVKNITFRTDNPPFKYHMGRFVKMIVDKLKGEKLFASQGGPIIMSQVENEYGNVERVFQDSGSRYIQWAGTMVDRLETGVPWTMCKQIDAPDPLINTCNGRHCANTFSGPNRPNKPSLWTENWTSHYTVFGEPQHYRRSEELAFSVARWFARNGTHVNYYMYYGGTNFGRTTSPFSTTQYYDDAPLDEYGLEREPKWGHLKDLHRALKLSQKALLWGNPSVWMLSEDVEVCVYNQPRNNVCAAFLTNNNTKVAATVQFRGKEHYLPPFSVSILPDCKTVVYNTKTVVSQNNSRSFVKSRLANLRLKWEMYREVIPTQLGHTSLQPQELYNLTKDTTDYAWFTTDSNCRIQVKGEDLAVGRSSLEIEVANLGHAMVAFVNGEIVGAAHGNHDDNSFVLKAPISLKPEANSITLLGSVMGLPDSGAYMERRFAGPRGVSILGMKSGRLDLTYNGWGHQVGLDGEKAELYTEAGSRRVKWTQIQKKGRAVTWYKTSFYAPEGRNPVVVRMTGMGKGMVWINGNSIGRYWMSYLSPLGQPTQSEYHIPRSFMKRRLNLMVILEEEEKANPEKIEILTVNRDTICSDIAEDHIPTVKSWARQQGKILKIVDMVHPAAQLRCPFHKKIVSIDFASFGDPSGTCGSYAEGNCSSPLSKSVVEKLCIGKNGCDIPAERKLFDGFQDQCAQMQKRLAVQVKCGK